MTDNGGEKRSRESLALQVHCKDEHATDVRAACLLSSLASSKTLSQEEKDSLPNVGFDPDICILIIAFLALEQEMPTPQDLETTPLDASYEFPAWWGEQEDVPKDVTERESPLSTVATRKHLYSFLNLHCSNVSSQKETQERAWRFLRVARMRASRPSQRLISSAADRGTSSNTMLSTFAP